MNATNFDRTIAANIARVLAAHAKPLPSYASSGIDYRFANGNAPEGWHLADGAETLPGHYRTYARRMTVVPLAAGYGHIKPFWSPCVYFVPDDETMKPQRVYDGNPLERHAKPVFVDVNWSKAKLQTRIFTHVMPAYVSLLQFQQKTGQRYEVLYMRERDRCLRTGDEFVWTEYPADPSSKH